jgi:Cu-processing system permease protein
VSNILAVATKEIQEGMRNRWVLATTLLLATLALTLTFLGSAPTGAVDAQALDVMVVSLSSLTIFLLPLIALLISHDAVVGEVERGTMLLLLSYPVSRSQVILGKFLGHIAILGIATLVGYGAAAATLLFNDEAIDARSWQAFGAMIGSSVLLGAAFIALGYLVSALARNRGTAAGAAIGVWLMFTLIYDAALLGLLVMDQGRTITGELLDTLLLLNPADAYRLLNLTGSEHTRLASGMAGIAATTGLTRLTLLGALATWCALPLTLAALVFSRRQL